MPHPHYKKLVESQVRFAIDQANVHGNVSHSGLKGLFREIVVKELLHPLLLHDVDIARGQIIDCQGGTSPECDVVLYHKNVIPAWIKEHTIGDIPLESALYNIEVKSTLDSGELKSSIAKAKAINELASLQLEGYPVVRPNNALFAFASDLSCTGKTDLDRYFESDPNAKTNPDIRALCVIGRGYWFHKNDGWIFWEPTEAFAEVTGFIGGILNTVATMLHYKPCLPVGMYFIDEDVKRQTVED